MSPSLTLVSLIVGLVLTSFAPRAQGAITSECLPSNPTSVAGFSNGDYRPGQTFTAQITGVLTSVVVGLSSTGPNGVIVEVRSTSYGLPTNTILASATIAGGPFASDSLQLASFASGPVLSAGATYAITLKAVDASPVISALGTYSPCSTGGTGKFVDTYSGGSSWNSRTDRSLAYRVNVEPVTSVVAAECVTTSQSSIAGFSNDDFRPGQVFTAQSSGVLTSVDLGLYSTGANDVVVEIRSTSGGLPTSTILASATISGGPFSTDVLHSASFASGLVLSEGTSYAITLRTVDSSPVVSLRGTYSPCSTGGTGAFVDTYSGGSSWSSRTDRSAAYRVNVVPTSCDIAAECEPAAPSNVAGFNDGDFRPGQVFTPQISGSLTSVELGLYSTGANDVVVEIRSTSGGLPTSTILASATISGGPFSTDVLHKADFTSGPFLIAGTAYAITLRAIGSSPVVSLRGTYSPCSTGGTGSFVHTYSGGTSWSSLSDRSIVYRVCVDAAPTTCAVGAECVSASSSQIAGFNNGNYRPGQVFIAQMTGLLTEVELGLASGGANDVVVEIRSTSNGLPTSTILASATIPGGPFTSDVLHTANFGSANLILVAGTTYAITLASVNSSPNIQVVGKFGACSTGGTGLFVHTYDSGSTWSTMNDRAFSYRVCVEPTTSVVDPIASQTSMQMTAWPSVSSGFTQLRLARPLATDQSITLFDVRGRKVRELDLPAGQDVATWDARDDRGLRVSSGVYFARIRSGAVTAKARILIVQ